MTVVHPNALINRYPGTCYRCGEIVPAETGLFTYEALPGLRWLQGKFQRNWPLVEHKSCAEKFAGTNVHYLYEAHDASS